jgi:putative transposase
MADFELTLLQTLGQNAERIIAWCVLPNHYHSPIETRSILKVVGNIGRMHGQTSFRWNGEEDRRGRKVWFNCAERFMRSERHFWATVNYIHHNPVRHGYVSRWQDWPFSSAGGYLSEMGREKAREIWLEHPLRDYGESWDAAEL